MSSSIAKFYSGRSLFITGGLGFIGKQILEKLLRSCPEMDSIYVLIRQKKGQTIEQRLQQTLTSPVFDRLRAEKPDFQRKLIPIVGDINEDFLGLSDIDHSRMASNVSIIIHSAATLNFQEPLRVAVNTNILGPRRVLTVARQLPKLDSLVHISTGYAHVDKGEQPIEERIYDPPITPQQAISMIREMTDEQLAKVTPELLKTHRRPNTYTFTKAIAEKLLEQERGNIPCCILRPTIVTGSYAEPFPGWVDNYTAANGIYTGYGTGFIRTVFTSHSQSKLDFVPVDMTANAIIASPWHMHKNRKGSEAPLMVYNLTDGGVLVKDLISIRMMANAHKFPFGPLPASRQLSGLAYSTHSRLVYYYITKVYMPVRCALIDVALRVMGRKPQMMKMHERIAKLQDVLLYFTANEFKWCNDNAKQMFESMNDSDKKDFDIQMGKVHSDQYFEDWWKGIKKYVLKEKKQVPSVQQSTLTMKPETAKN